jgi:MFS family permease
MQDMKRNVALLGLCQALLMTCNSLMLTVAALVGYALASNKALATVPLALIFLFAMVMAAPASLWMQRVGRKRGFMSGALFGVAGAVVASMAIVKGSFVMFCAGSALVGACNAFGQYYRFAAAEVAGEAYRSRAISLVLAGGVVAAFAGPNLANWSRDLIQSSMFLGSYVWLLGLYIFSLLVLGLTRFDEAAGGNRRQPGRGVTGLVRQPMFVVAVLNAMIAYGVMSLIMTATPLAMHGHAHPFGETSFVIQWHVFGMFAPSFFTGHIIHRYGLSSVMLAGVAMMFVCVLINLHGSSVMHYWAALLLLGVGWNFLFVSATTLLTECYRPEEKARAQGFNDFMVWGTVAISSLSSGALLHHLGWRAVNFGVMPMIACLLLSSLWLRVHQRRVLASV